MIGLWQPMTSPNHMLKSHSHHCPAVETNTELGRSLRLGLGLGFMVLGLGFRLNVVDHAHNQKAVIRKSEGSR